MKNFKNYISIFVILIVIMAFVSCGNDENNQDNEDVFADCCSEAPVYGPNVNNLDQSAGEIVVYNLFTPNGDGINDYFVVENIELYNHVITIYNSDDEVIFETSNYTSSGSFFPDVVQTEQGMAEYPDGTYNYKIVVENKQVYKKSGTFCLFGNFSALEEQNFNECTFRSQFDPILTGY